MATADAGEYSVGEGPDHPLETVKHRPDDGLDDHELAAGLEKALSRREHFPGRGDDVIGASAHEVVDEHDHRDGVERAEFCRKRPGVATH